MYRGAGRRAGWRPSSLRALTRPALLPLADRLRYFRLLRLVVATSVALVALVVPFASASAGSVAGAMFAWVAVAVLVERLWRRAGSTAPAAAAALLMLDAVAPAWAAAVAGSGAAGWLVRCLVLLLVVALALLASRRALVAGVVAHAALQVGAGAHAGVAAGGIAAYVVVLLVLSLTVVWLSAVTVRELQRRRFELEALAAMGRSLEEAHDPTAVGNVLLDSVCATFGFRRIVLFDVPDGTLRMLTCGGVADAVVRDFVVSEQSVLTTALRERRAAVVARLDPAADPWLDGVLPRARRLVVMPLTADEVVGVLVAEPGGGLDQRALATMERFTAHAAFALRNAVLLERVQQMAVTDALTRLANRRSFDRALARDLARAQRTDGRLSVVLIDVDEFKRLNDTHGHVVGDAVLQQVAAVLQDCGREYDTVARYGGEEFAVVLPGCSTSLAERVAERLRSRVEGADTPAPVTVSAGVATFPAHGNDAHSLLESADYALYAAKHAGRNRVVTVDQARARHNPAAG